jgi:hypothetical protein
LGVGWLGFKRWCAEKQQIEFLGKKKIYKEKKFPRFGKGQ